MATTSPPATTAAADNGGVMDREDREELHPGDEAPVGTPGAGENVCRTCSGTGLLDGQTCATCGGTGVVLEEIGGA